MKKSFVILLMVLFLSTISSYAFSPFGMQGMKIKKVIGIAYKLSNELDLTDEQKDTIYSVITDSAMKIIPIVADNLVTRIKIVTELRKDEPNINLINPMIDTIAAKKAEVFKTLLKGFIDIKKTLTKNQIEKIKDIVKNQIERKFKKGMKKHKFKGMGRRRGRRIPIK